jgi:hypothetical protein
MRLNNINNINNKYPLTSLNLLLLSEYKDINNVIDTDNIYHLECLERLVKRIPSIQLHFFIGSSINNQWMTAPDPHVVIGNGTHIIRILNKGMHFECITNDSSSFVRAPRTMTLEKVIQNQLEQEKRLNTSHKKYSF